MVASKKLGAGVNNGMRNEPEGGLPCKSRTAVESLNMKEARSSSLLDYLAPASFYVRSTTPLATQASFDGSSKSLPSGSDCQRQAHQLAHIMRTYTGGEELALKGSYSGVFLTE